MSLYRCIGVSLCRCIGVLQCLCRSVAVALWRCIACLAVPLYCCIAPSLCRCVVVSLYRCVAESLSRCFAVSSYRCVADTFSSPGGDSGKSQELSWTLSCSNVLRRRRSPVLMETAENSASRPSFEMLPRFSYELSSEAPKAMPARRPPPRATSCIAFFTTHQRFISHCRHS